MSAAILSNGAAATDTHNSSDQSSKPYPCPAPQLADSDPLTFKAKSTAPAGPNLNEQTDNASLAFTASAVSDDGVFLDEEVRGQPQAAAHASLSPHEHMTLQGS